MRDTDNSLAETKSDSSNGSSPDLTTTAPAIDLSFLTPDKRITRANSSFSAGSSDAVTNIDSISAAEPSSARTFRETAPKDQSRIESKLPLMAEYALASMEEKGNQQSDTDKQTDSDHDGTELDQPGDQDNSDNHQTSSTELQHQTYLLREQLQRSESLRAADKARLARHADKIRELESIEARLRVDLEEITNLYNALQQKNQQILASQADKKNFADAELTEQNQRLQDDLATVRDRLASVTRLKNDITARIIIETQLRERLQAEAATFNEQFRLLEQSHQDRIHSIVAEKDSAILEVTRQLEDLQSKQTDNDAKLIARSFSIQLLEQQLEEIESQKIKDDAVTKLLSEQDNAAHTRQRIGFKFRIIFLQNKLRNEKLSLSIIQTENSKLKQQNSDLAAELAIMQQDQIQLVQSFTQQMNEHNDVNQQLKEQIASLQAETQLQDFQHQQQESTIAKAIIEQQALHSATQTENSKLKQDNTELTKLISDLTGKFAESEKQNQVLENEITAIRGQIATLIKELDQSITATEKKESQQTIVSNEQREHIQKLTRLLNQKELMLQQLQQAQVQSSQLAKQQTLDQQSLLTATQAENSALKQNQAVVAELITERLQQTQETFLQQFRSFNEAIDKVEQRTSNLNSKVKTLLDKKKAKPQAHDLTQGSVPSAALSSSVEPLDPSDQTKNPAAHPQAYSTNTSLHQHRLKPFLIEEAYAYGHVKQQDDKLLTSNEATKHISTEIDRLQGNKYLTCLSEDASKTSFNHGIASINFTEDASGQYEINVSDNFSGLVVKGRVDNPNLKDSLFYRNGKIIDYNLAYPLPTSANSKLYNVLSKIVDLTDETSAYTKFKLPSAEENYNKFVSNNKVDKGSAKSR